MSEMAQLFRKQGSQLGGHHSQDGTDTKGRVNRPGEPGASVGGSSSWDGPSSNSNTTIRQQDNPKRHKTASKAKQSKAKQSKAAD
jgi:hypothetical protein